MSRWVVALILSLPAQARSAGAAPAVSYESFLAAVASGHPERLIDETRRAEAHSIGERSGLLADPVLTIGRDEAPLPNALQAMPADPMGLDAAQWQVSLSQSIPWPGTLAAERDAASARVTSVDRQSAATAAIRRFEAAELFLRLVRTAKLIEIQRASLDVVHGIRNFANEKFKQGLGSHFEFLKSHSEAGVLRANIGALETDLENLKRHALLLMNDPKTDDPGMVEFTLEWPKNSLSTGSPQPPSDQADVSRKWLEEQRRVTLAQKEADYLRSLPTFSASGMLMQEDGGMRMYGMAIGASVPIFSGVRRESLASEKALVDARTGGELAWYDKRRKLALAQVEGRIDRILGNLRILEREIIPPVREHLDSAMVRFGQGKEDIAHIIGGRQTLLGLETDTVLMSEALARARLAYEKVAAGLVDAELDMPLPQLSGAASGGMGMSPSSGASMPGMAPPRSSSPAKEPGRSPTDASPEENAPPAGGMSGMGM